MSNRHETLVSTEMARMETYRDELDREPEVTWLPIYPDAYEALFGRKVAKRLRVAVVTGRGWCAPRKRPKRLHKKLQRRGFLRSIAEKNCDEQK